MCKYLPFACSGFITCTESGLLRLWQEDGEQVGHKVSSSADVLSWIENVQGTPFISIAELKILISFLFSQKLELNVGENVCRIRQNTQQCHLVATGGKENDLKVWDLTNPSAPIFKAKNVSPLVENMVFNFKVYWPSGNY